MKNIKIIISGGSFPWMGIEEIISLAQETGYDGIELLPTRKIVNETEESAYSAPFIENIHQNWRLDIGLDKSYGIRSPVALLFTILRLILFPKIKKSNEAVKILSENLNLPVVVHGLSDNWTKTNDEEFPGGILYEILGTAVSPKNLKRWMEKTHHNIIIDSRDDQSLVWAQRYGFNTWKTFWKWLGIEKIKGYQLTFIGIKGLKRVLTHEKSLAEEQLLWLNKNKWEGHVTVEINPLVLIFLFRGNVKKGLMVINQFVKQTLIEGKKWSD